jgi:hypothetical protein
LAASRYHAVTDGRREADDSMIEGVVRALRGRPLRHLRAVS